MNVRILIGDKNSWKEYVDDFSKKHSLHPSYHFTYEKVGVLEAIDIRKKSKLFSNACLFEIGNITLEAQNSLLKTLEEIQNNTYIFFLATTPDSLLQTICSRCQIVRLNKDNAKTEELKEIKDFFNETSVSNAISLSDIATENLELFVQSLRNFVIENLESNKNKNAVEILSEINFSYNLITKNNINKKVFFDNLFLKYV